MPGYRKDNLTLSIEKQADACLLGYEKLEGDLERLQAASTKPIRKIEKRIARIRNKVESFKNMAQKIGGPWILIGAAFAVGIASAIGRRSGRSKSRMALLRTLKRSVPSSSDILKKFDSEQGMRQVLTDTLLGSTKVALPMIISAILSHPFVKKYDRDDLTHSDSRQNGYKRAQNQ